MSRLDTIVALATPPGRGGVGIIRVSGKNVSHISKQLLKKDPSTQTTHYLPFYDENNNIIDRGIVLRFKAPHSFTGEDVLELQGHGGPVVLDTIIKAILKTGARLARPGEFSQRAFLNDKLDLAQAEAICDLINAGSAQAARSAMRSLDGAFSQSVQSIQEKLTQLRLYIEASIDFPEEEIDFLKEGQVAEKLEAILFEFSALKNKAQQGALLRDGMNLVIVGKPNAGKSTLLNALCGKDVAIVTDVPGTTRDVMRETIQLDGMPIHIMDTAGLRETQDKVEQIGIERAYTEVGRADRLLLLIDAKQTNDEQMREQVQQLRLRVDHELPITIIVNKIDLTGQSQMTDRFEGSERLFLSIKTSEGLDSLSKHLKNVMGYQVNLEGVFMARRRHIEALEKTHDTLQRGQKQLIENNAGELLAADLMEAQRFLSEITGQVSADELLGKIFGQFCIGK